MRRRTYSLVAGTLVVLVLLGGYALLQQPGGPVSTTTRSTGTQQTSTATTGSESSVTTSGTATSSFITSIGPIFSFQPPQFSGGDEAVSSADFGAHQGDTNEWLEVKIVPSNMSGWIWYIHADYVGATNSVGGDWSNVTTHSNSTVYPQGVASYNTATSYLRFDLTSVPSTGGSTWIHNARAGDVVECYPFSSKAFWASGSNFYWSGNCKLTSGGSTVSGVGHFIRTWQGGGGVNGAPLPTCVPHLQFEGVFSIVSTLGSIQILDMLCSGIPRYQVGGVLWFDTGGYETIGTTEGKQSTSESPQNSACTLFTLTIPTSRGTLTGNLTLNRYFGGGCSAEDGSLVGQLTLNGMSYEVLGIMAEFRCVTGYC